MPCCGLDCGGRQPEANLGGKLLEGEEVFRGSEEKHHANGRPTRRPGTRTTKGLARQGPHETRYETGEVVIAGITQL
jgi:hypothetical protein